MTFKIQLYIFFQRYYIETLLHHASSQKEYTFVDILSISNMFPSRIPSSGQDLGVRLDQVPSFAKGLEQHGELPFWMCPVRGGHPVAGISPGLEQKW